MGERYSAIYQYSKPLEAMACYNTIALKTAARVT
jgi:hypothetical protein